MNWVQKLILLSSISILSITANEVIQTLSPEVEVKAGYLIFTSQKMREVYGTGAFEVQACGCYPIAKNLQIYSSIGFSEAWGKSIHFHQKTTFWRIPVDLGLKPMIHITPSIQWYATIGPRYFYGHQHNSSHYVNRSMGKSGVGGFVNTGFNFFPKPHLFIDLFGEYSYEQLHFSTSKAGVEDRSLQVGGVYLGAGLGYSF